MRRIEGRVLVQVRERHGFDEKVDLLMAERVSIGEQVASLGVKLRVWCGGVRSWRHKTQVGGASGVYLATCLVVREDIGKKVVGE
ncbi:hypothetical protein LXL04_039046 [Taraxacum kok-saghyz]